MKRYTITFDLYDKKKYVLTNEVTGTFKTDIKKKDKKALQEQIVMYSNEILNIKITKAKIVNIKKMPLLKEPVELKITIEEKQ